MACCLISTKRPNNLQNSFCLASVFSAVSIPRVLLRRVHDDFSVQGPAQNNKSEDLVSTCLATLPPYSLNKSSTSVTVTTCGPLFRARAVNQLWGSEHASNTMGRDRSTLYKVTIARVLIPGSETCNGGRSTPPSWQPVQARCPVISEACASPQ